MTRGVWPLVTSAQMRALDEHTIEALGLPGSLLMESAGRAVAEAALALRAGHGPVLVICGTGNNGGDGLVAARHLHQAGVAVRVVLLGDPARLRGEAAANRRRVEALGLELEGERWRAPSGSGVLIDAIFGTGLTREVSGPAAASIRRIEAAREAGARVLAVDLPSGVCANTGRVLGVAVSADLTLTLGLPKLGLALEPARSRAGEIRVARIGIADAAPGVDVQAEIWTRAEVGRRLPERPEAGHKGTFGHALLVAGSEGKTGAAALAAEAALRVGAGLATIGCPAGLNDILEVKCTEAMTAPLPDTGARALAAAAEPAILSLAATRDAVGLGPGIGRDEETLGLVRAVAKQLEIPLVLDADALLAFASDLPLLTGRAAATILTPHPGEAAALLGGSPADINGDRPAAARRLAAETGAVVLLKGAGTLTAEPTGRLIANPTGGPVLGSGGSGDVLLGMVVGLLAQGVAPVEAAALAAYLHGAAADEFAQRVGGAGLLASELAGRLPAVLAALRRTPRPTGMDDGLVVAFPEP